MSTMLHFSLVAVVATCLAGYASASQQQVETVCLTNEIERELISSSMAITAGECHLHAANGDQQLALQHAQFAYSWFSYAQQLSDGISPSYLKLAAAKIDELRVK